MSDKELIKQLKQLKTIKPEASWTSDNRALLLSQIANAGATKLSAGRLFLINLNCSLRALARPAYALGAFVIILVVGIFSHQLLTSIKPTDSLYIARIISEKAKLSTVISPAERDALSLKFSLSHATDISEVLADPSFNTVENQVKVAKLNDSFNKELENIRTKIATIKPKSEPTANETEAAEEIFILASEESATEQGLEISLSPEAEEPKDEEAEELEPSEEAEIKLELNVSPSSSLELVTTEEASTSSLSLSLEEAQKLSESKDFDQVNVKLRELRELIK
ncbi:MAG: hypothetical protein ACOX0C_02325 [Patescibacteria group bacterium]|jgi:hypothetical protein